jgi:phage portal protein BeeE
MDRALATMGLRRFAPLSIDDWVQMFSFGNAGMMPTTTLGSKEEQIGGGFTSLIQGAYQANGVVFACMLARMALFAEARFQFQQLRKGRPGNLYSTPALARLEEPWPGATTGDMLKGAITDADTAGNAFLYRQADRITRLRPDWVTIIIGSYRNRADVVGWDMDAEVAGYLYHPGGRSSGQDPVVMDRRLVAHFKPVPDPLASYRGMSWLLPVVREIMGDSAATSHKLKFFENGATPNMAVSFDSTVDPAKARDWINLFNEGHVGYQNAYKTMFLGGGSSFEVIGANLRQIDFKQVQGAGETRIAAAAGVPPIIVGLSEGLQAATYSNYGQARRRYADLTMRPLWRDMASSLAAIIDVPGGSRLWYDDRDIPFLQEDVQDAATIQASQSSTIRQLTDAGFTPESVIDAVVAGDFQRLEHTGLFSVQLQPPGSVASPVALEPEAINDQRAIAQLMSGFMGAN